MKYIESKELRIGNYVKCPLDETFLKVTTLKNKLIIASKGENINYNAIEPFPLTEEILLKCGFVEGDNKWFNEMYYTDCKEATELFVISFNLVSNRLAIYEIDMEDTCIFTGKKVYYLHQLQNLFYALTGEELTVEL